MTNPYVFIVGCPRSGTTLFRHMVDAHPQIAITPEAHWIPLWFEERRGLTAEGMITPALISVMLQDSKFAMFRLSREDVLALGTSGQPMSYARFVACIFDLYGRREGKAIVGNKTPDSARRMRTLHALWPEARFVHLIRDGRDVALSLINWPRVHQKKPGTFPTWKDDPVATAALWWELNVRCGRQAGQWLGPDLYCEIRYESLIANPAAECAALCSFLGLPYDEAILRYHARRPDGIPNGRVTPDWRPIQRGLRDWRSQMSAEDIDRFEAVAGDLLDELGYPRVVPRSSPENLDRAVRVRGLLAGDLRKMTFPRQPVSVPLPPPGNSDTGQGR